MKWASGLTCKKYNEYKTNMLISKRANSPGLSESIKKIKTIADYPFAVIANDNEIVNMAV